MGKLLTAALLACASADFIGTENFVGQKCGGDVFETSVIFPSGCTAPRTPSPSFQSYNLACVNASAAMLHLFATADCTGKSQSFPFTPVEFGCNHTSIAPNTLLTSCKPGDYAPLPNALDSAFASGKPRSLPATLSPRPSLPHCPPCLQFRYCKAQARAPPRRRHSRCPPFAWTTALTAKCRVGRQCPSSGGAMTRT